MKWDCFKQIFKMLDSDEDDYINKITMDLRKVPKRIITIIEPLLQELRSTNENINEEEFTHELNVLFEVKIFYL